MTTGRRAAVIIASTRAATGVYEDKTGPLIVEWLRGKGFTVHPTLVPDGDAIGAALRAA
ncbi:MAG: MogA/MoaB family molybdenum cofactor biosynthesis protein, partial [Actinomycetota bacterium]|nr:MogA/MoaB family molybdenum cofactor biosynthesis protein [Actinomycetota bacterium]